MENTPDLSFSHNQSCPNMMTSSPFDRRLLGSSYFSPKFRRVDTFMGNEMNSVSFNSSHNNSSVHHNESLCSGTGYRSSFSLAGHHDVSNTTTSSVKSTRRAAGSNGKAHVTFDIATNKILTASRGACRLFGVDDLTDHNLTSYFTKPLMCDGEDDDNGDVVMSGKIMEVRKNNNVTAPTIPVAVWMKKTTSGRCVTVIERIARMHTSFIIDKQGEFLQAATNVASVFGTLPSLDDNFQLFIPKALPPSQDQDTDLRFLCGISYNEQQTDSGEDVETKEAFPLTVQVTEKAEAPGTYDCAITVYTNIIGGMSLDENGNILNFNANFAALLLGYTSRELKKMHIKRLIPGLTSHHLCEILMTSPSAEFSFDDDSENDNENARFVIVETPEKKRKSDLVTSTPLVRKQDNDELVTVKSLMIRHGDSSLFPIDLQYKKLESPRVIWIRYVFDPPVKQEQPHQRTPLAPSRDVNPNDVSNDNEDDGFHTSGNSSEATKTSGDDGAKHEVDEEANLIGEITKHYKFVDKLGSGAFGFVYLAHHIATSKRVAVKFITKAKVVKENMKQGVPLEIYLLSTLRHASIVRCLAHFENEKYYQCVMSTHGDKKGGDMFDFIDENPVIDEMLGSYIFRQICSAVNYLHHLGIVHRDIKDENIIIDENYRCKLIDFGSACYFKEHEQFTQFYGTFEYCAPEVLNGDSYYGPQVEIWALGVTLFTLMCGENPFGDAEEIIKAAVVIPDNVCISRSLTTLLESILTELPQHRATIQDVLFHPWLHVYIDPSQFPNRRDENDENRPRDDDSDVTSDKSTIAINDDAVASTLSGLLDNIKI